MAEQLANLARRAQERPEFLAAFLAAFARSEDNMDEDALCAHLGCAVEQLPRLRLCRAPGDDRVQMLKDVARVAEHFGLREPALREAVLRGRVILRLRQAREGILMAARDREQTP